LDCGFSPVLAATVENISNPTFAAPAGAGQARSAAASPAITPAAATGDPVSRMDVYPRCGAGG